MIAMSTPFALLPPLQRALYDKIKARDAEFYDRLRAAGFLLDFGPDETGLLMKAYRTGSGYYIDVGCSQLIIDGEIKLTNQPYMLALRQQSLVLLQRPWPRIPRPSAHREVAHSTRPARVSGLAAFTVDRIT